MHLACAHAQRGMLEATVSSDQHGDRSRARRRGRRGRRRRSGCEWLRDPAYGRSRACADAARLTTAASSPRSSKMPATRHISSARPHEVAALRATTMLAPTGDLRLSTRSRPFERDGRAAGSAAHDARRGGACPWHDTGGTHGDPAPRRSGARRDRGRGTRRGSRRDMSVDRTFATLSSFVACWSRTSPAESDLSIDDRRDLVASHCRLRRNCSTWRRPAMALGSISAPAAGFPGMVVAILDRAPVIMIEPRRHACRVPADAVVDDAGIAIHVDC